MPRILVVDDQASMRQLIAAIVRQSGFPDVDEAPDGAEALLLMYDTDYALVICDWHMPNMDGLGLLKAVRDIDSMRDVPFVMMTGDTERSDDAELKALGISGFIRKPFDMEKIVETLRTAVIPEN